MRIAIVSDIHGNRTAFEAVLAHLGQTSPDLILHGGDAEFLGAGMIGSRGLNPRSSRIPGAGKDKADRNA